MPETRDETASIKYRLTAEEHALIRRAAACKEVPMTTFTREATIDAARNVLAMAACGHIEVPMTAFAREAAIDSALND